MSAPLSTPRASQRVLPTLNADGTRRLIRPRLYAGPKWRARRVVAWVLMVTFVALPWLRVGGRPVVLLDVARREFTLFGRTFLPTDGVLLMLLLLAIFVAIVLVTALVGRAWCGWACPQTVYMEFLYRPIERLFEGKRERQLELDKKGANLARFAKNGVFLLVSILLGNAFLAYFVGTDALEHWISRSPSEHPTAFLVMAVAAGLTFFDFAYFREQMCTVICPYARLQSVLLDRRSLVVGYDPLRGEPRSKGKSKPGSGDCIDCGACVVACPTGIDIRQGLQLECIACTQCADACDSIMARIKKPPGLIRYAGQESLETGRPNRLVRARVGVYAGILVALLVALVATANTRGDAEVTILRGIGAPFELREGFSVNQIRVKVRNRSDVPRRYRIELLDAGDTRLIAPENPLVVAAGEQRSTSLFVMADPALLPHGRRTVRFRVSDGAGFEATTPYEVLGPAGTPAMGSAR
ncbi:MAG TPA: cytochrome c oxidase accessory protein CcoG [Polyangiaceae bacterium]|nr:cytochrome c oxidase accessory protein CcoG [Polyangiaceae bacterium]